MKYFLEELNTKILFINCQTKLDLIKKKGYSTTNVSTFIDAKFSLREDYYNIIIIDSSCSFYEEFISLYNFFYAKIHLIILEREEGLKVNKKDFNLENINVVTLLKDDPKNYRVVNKNILKYNTKVYKKLLGEYKEIVDSSTIISKTNASGIITYANDNFCKISGYKKEELIGSTHRIVRHPDVPAEFFIKLWKDIKNKKTWKGIIKNRDKHGRTYYVKTLIKALLDAKNEITGYITLRDDITDFMNPKEKLIEDISILNKPVLFIAKIEDFEALENYYERETVKGIEEVFSKKILSFFPKDSGFDQLYNLGDGEFAFIKECTKTHNNEEDFLAIKEFQNNVQRSILHVNEYQYNINVIISYDFSKDNLFENVKLGIKKAISDKLDLVNAANLSSDAKIIAHKNIKTIEMIKDAIESNNIITYYQPIFYNKEKVISKHESLVRIINKNNEIISPYSFIDIAKKGKYYTNITDTMIDNIFESMSTKDKTISLNLSSLDIENAYIRDKLLLLMQEKDIASKLIIELLEDEESKDFETVKKFINTVKRLGVKIAIDDFGAGYSNFNRLMQFEPDILKIDGSLIKNIDTDVYSKNIVETIVAFAQKQKIDTVAEFVHKKEIFDIVNELEIDYSQGYYIGEPKPEFLN